MNYKNMFPVGSTVLARTTPLVEWNDKEYTFTGKVIFIRDTSFGTEISVDFSSDLQIKKLKELFSLHNCEGIIQSNNGRFFYSRSNKQSIFSNFDSIEHNLKPLKVQIPKLKEFLNA